MPALDFLQLVLNQGIPCCLLAFGVFLTFKVLDFADMTAEGSLLIGGALCAVCIYNGVHPILATILGMLGGAVCGLITGVLNRLLHIPKILSGIITMTATTSIALLIFGTTTPTVFSASVTLTKDGHSLATIFSCLPASVFKGWQVILLSAIVISVVIAICYFFFGTEYGMAIRATGINERMAKAQGINTTLTTIVCVTISNALIGLAGALISQIDGGMYATSATGYLIVGLASILIGTTIFGSRSFKNSLISICLGSILYFTIISLATFVFKMPTEMNKFLYAILIVIALCLPMIKKGCVTLFHKIFKKKKVEVE